MEHWRLLPLSAGDAFWNMAVDEAILEHCKCGNVANTLRLYLWQPSAVSIGRNQAIRDEVNLDMTAELGIDVVRRISGGGAVFHADKGEITYSIAINERLIPKAKGSEPFFKLARGISVALSELGLAVEEEIIHCPSIFVRDRKISGNAQAQRGEIILQHGTLLLSYDPDLMYTVLRTKGQRTKKKMVQSVFQQVTTLEQELGYLPTQEKIAETLVNGFQKSFGVSFIQENLSDEEISLANRLKEEKYSSPEWTFKY